MGEVMTCKINQQLEELAIQYGMTDERPRRGLLRPHHIEEYFSSSSSFDKFARTVCRASAIPRKELFEAWAVAVHIHQHFPTAGRIADIAASHGLLSWALLWLSENDEEQHCLQPRTVVCVDKRMPASAEKLEQAMRASDECSVNLFERWDYVEGRLQSIEPASSTLLTGVHCCSTLSDAVIDLAIAGNASLALVPCCHSKKSFKLYGLERDSPFPKDQTPFGGKDNLADFVDSCRIRRLISAGFNVQEAKIPTAFTPKNRIILARAPELLCQLILNPTSKGIEETLCPPVLKSKSKRRIPKLCIPVADTPEAKATVRALSGREAANRRKLHLPSLSISVFLPPRNLLIPLDQLSALATSLDPSVKATANYIDPLKATPHWDAASARHTQTFRIQYDLVEQDKASALSKERAKQLTIQLCGLIPTEFPGSTVRQVPT